MIGVTIGIGGRWPEAAKAACIQVRQMTGIECQSIEADHYGCVHPSWLKLKIPEIFPHEDSFFYFDADVLMLKAWNVSRMFEEMGRPFMAVPDVRANVTKRECQNFNLPYPDWYINAGILVFGKEHRPILEAAFNYHPQYGSWLEQTALNKALLKSNVEICRLPRTFNTLLLPQATDYSSNFFRSSDRVVLHAISMRGKAARLINIQALAFRGHSI